MSHFCILLSSRNGLFGRSASFPFQCSLLPCVFHSFRPYDDFWPVPHLYYCLGGNQIKVMHFVTVGAENNKVLRIIIFPVTIEMGDFQHVWNAKATMGAKWPVNFQGYFAVIICLFHWFELMPLLFLLTPNARHEPTGATSIAKNHRGYSRSARWRCWVVCYSSS